MTTVTPAPADLDATGTIDPTALHRAPDDAAPVVLHEAAEAVAAIARGELVVVVDDEDRENEGDLIVAADHATAEAVNFMVTHGRGLVCLSLTAGRAAELRLPPMVERNEDHMGTAFTVSIDGTPENGVTTGISAPERARTIALALDGTATDLARPGHIFPLVARDGGVLERPGHTEAAVDLARFAGLRPAGVIVEIINPDGTMSRLPQLVTFAARHGLVLTSIEKLRAYSAARNQVQR
ncbi:3,4-dihydroxy-2-butanone-4-phosphate synthase [Streptomyces spiramenti]|uniref:3,4-dihydroxy-2-butanone 4-phosphate synthase n=1 Tax=Streptomyces spiramenti TaxID=2720606 RepID=A0ABX1AGN5_9ACTN|nr:3,4-dihydroxy-2-butanone-4-phosphate synthase [Streptomyces spiramenti]